MKAPSVNFENWSRACKGQPQLLLISEISNLRTFFRSDLTTLREQQYTAESDAQNLTSQTQAMLNLNLKLQSTVNKGQVRTIELDLRKLEAAQAVERLSITRVCILAVVVCTSTETVCCSLIFRRTSLKLTAMPLMLLCSLTD